MKIVLIRTPSFLSPIIKKIFAAADGSQRKIDKKGKKGRATSNKK